MTNYKYLKENMDKFDLWNIEKQKLNKKDKKIYFHERDIWFISMGKNIGFEQDGKGKFFWRPVIVVKKFNNNIFYGIPLTTKNKTGIYYYDFIFNSIPNKAILSQLKLFDSKRLLEKKGKIDLQNFIILKQKIKELFE